MIISQILRFGFSKEVYQFFILKMVSLRSVGNRCVHGVFENIFTFETQISSHAKKSKDKQNRITCKPTKQQKHNRTRVEISGS